MANKKNFCGMLVMVLVFGITACPEDDNSGDGGGKTPEEMTVAERWGSWFSPGSGVTASHSVAVDGVCTITVGGTALTGPAWDQIWKANASYSYTAQAGVTYAYEFETWTDGGDRTLMVQWYEDQEKGVYHNTGYTSDGAPRFTITDQRKTYVVTGDVPIPKSGEQLLSFHFANQTGTFYVKILSITIANTDPKTLVINGIQDLIGEYYTDGMIGLFPAGTTIQQALQAAEDFYQTGDWGIIVAGANLSDADLNSNYTTAYFSLYSDYNIRWTGSGSYMIGTILEDNYGGYRFFWTGPVNFSSATTTITFNPAWEITLPDDD